MRHILEALMACALLWAASACGQGADLCTGASCNADDAGNEHLIDATVDAAMDAGEVACTEPLHSRQAHETTFFQATSVVPIWGSDNVYYTSTAAAGNDFRAALAVIDPLTGNTSRTFELGSGSLFAVSSVKSPDEIVVAWTAPEGTHLTTINRSGAVLNDSLAITRGDSTAYVPESIVWSAAAQRYIVVIDHSRDLLVGLFDQNGRQRSELVRLGYGNASVHPVAAAVGGGFAVLHYPSGTGTVTKFRLSLISATGALMSAADVSGSVGSEAILGSDPENHACYYYRDGQTQTAVDRLCIDSTGAVFGNERFALLGNWSRSYWNNDRFVYIYGDGGENLLREIAMDGTPMIGTATLFRQPGTDPNVAVIRLGWNGRDYLSLHNPPDDFNPYHVQVVTRCPG